jgi:pyruvate dehydrogenase E1 component beta subunit
MPATPADAAGLLRAAVDDPNPVLVLEHKLLYKQKGEVPAATTCRSARPRCAAAART